MIDRRVVLHFELSKHAKKLQILHFRCTILRCIGEVAVNMSEEELETFAEFRRKTDEICQKFIMPAVKSTHPSLKLAALRAASDIAKVCQKDSSSSDSPSSEGAETGIVTTSILFCWLLKIKDRCK